MNIMEKMRLKSATKVAAKEATLQASPPEQGAPEMKVPTIDEKLDQIIANQGVIVANQQVILDKVVVVPEVTAQLSAELVKMQVMKGSKKGKN